MLVLVGQRRVGKSFILKSLAEWLHRNKPDSKVLFIDKDFDSFSFIKTSKDLYSHAIDNLLAGGENYLLFDEVPEIDGYLQGVYNTIVLKDIVAREQVRNVKFLENLIRFIADNVGQLVSVNSIVKYLKSQGTKVSNDATTKYVKAICSALIVDSVSRYDIHGNRIFELIEQYYFCDHGLCNSITYEMPNVFGSIEKIMENVVRNHLLIQNFDVYVGVISSGEIDFVAKRGEQTIYFQVAYNLVATMLLGEDLETLRLSRTIIQSMLYLWKI